MKTASLIGVVVLISGLGACTFTDCEGIKDRAYAMVEEAGACSPEHECVQVSYYDLVAGNSCLGAFLCDGVFGAHVDLEEFAVEGKDLVQSFRTCNECVVAACLNPEKLVPRCNLDTGLCELAPVTE